MTRSNLAACGMRLVRKGLRVALGARRGLVVKVRRGFCLVLWDGERYARPHGCAELALEAVSRCYEAGPAQDRLAFA